MVTSPDWKKTWRLAMIVHTAMVAMLFVYAIALEILKAAIHPMPRLLAARTTILDVRYGFYALAIVAVLLARVVNGRRLLKHRAGESPEDFLHRLVHAAVFTSILCETPAVLGLVLVFLEGASLDFYYLVFVSLFLSFLYYPRSRTWAGLIDERFPGRA